MAESHAAEAFRTAYQACIDWLQSFRRAHEGDQGMENSESALDLSRVVGSVVALRGVAQQHPRNSPETARHTSTPPGIGRSVSADEGGVGGGECSDSDRLKAPTPIKPPRTQRARAIPTYSEAFLMFWNAFPRRNGKGSKVKAYEVWARLSKTDQELASGDLLARIANHPDWHSPRDSGRYLPMVTTYLRGRIWDDGWGQEPATAQEVVPEPDYECVACGREYSPAEADALAGCVGRGCGAALRPKEGPGA